MNLERFWETHLSLLSAAAFPSSLVPTTSRKWRPSRRGGPLKNPSPRAHSRTWGSCSTGGRGSNGGARAGTNLGMAELRSGLRWRHTRWPWLRNPHIQAQLPHHTGLKPVARWGQERCPLLLPQVHLVELDVAGDSRRVTNRTWRQGRAFEGPPCGGCCRLVEATG